MSIMKVQEYIKEHGIEKLQEEFSIVVTDYPDRVVLNYNQIDSPRFHPICDECRALILRKGTWEVMARSFDRFYNVGEGEEWKTFPIDKARFEEKLDGSILSVYHDGSEWCVSTRKMAFAEGTLPIGITFRQLFDSAVKNTDVWNMLKSNAIAPHFTWVFELTSPENRIVTPYSDRSVTLIGVRSNENGEEVYRLAMDEFANEMGVNRPKLFECTSIEDLQKQAEALSAMDEGFVLVVERGVCDNIHSHWRLKCKNPKYVAIAHMRDNGGISPKRIMTLLINRDHFEYLGYFPEDKKYFDFCDEIYLESLNRIKAIADVHLSIEDQKEFALTIMPLTEYGHEKGILFNARKGVPIEESLKKMGGKKVSESLGLRGKFIKAFDLDVEDDEK